LDSDGDGMPDAWEISHDLDPDRFNARGDKDHDLLRNDGEYRAATDPRDEDTDNDGIDDGDEAKVYSSDPIVSDENGNKIPDGNENGADGGYYARLGSEDADDAEEICRGSDDDIDGDGLDDEDEDDKGLLADRDGDGFGALSDPDSDGDGIDDGDDDADWDSRGLGGASGIDDEDEDDVPNDWAVWDSRLTNEPCLRRDEERDDKRQNLTALRLSLFQVADALASHRDVTGSYYFDWRGMDDDFDVQGFIPQPQTEVRYFHGRPDSFVIAMGHIEEPYAWTFDSVLESPVRADRYAWDEEIESSSGLP
jgi:hypothetical protein